MQYQQQHQSPNQRQSHVSNDENDDEYMNIDDGIADHTDDYLQLPKQQQKQQPKQPPTKLQPMPPQNNGGGGKGGRSSKKKDEFEAHQKKLEAAVETWLAGDVDDDLLGAAAGGWRRWRW
jgi:hypothetical protein